MLSAISNQQSAKATSFSVKKACPSGRACRQAGRRAESASLKTESSSQKGFSPLAILILVVLGVFIFWEINATLERQFESPKTALPTPTPTATPCPIPNDPSCLDLDSGGGFNL